MKSYEELCTALDQMINRTNTISIPARENEDADLILAKGIREHKEMGLLLEKARLELESWNLQSGDEDTLNLTIEINNLIAK